MLCRHVTHFSNGRVHFSLSTPLMFLRCEQVPVLCETSTFGDAVYCSLYSVQHVCAC